MFLLRKPILALSASDTVRKAMLRIPLTRSVVQRFVAGETTTEVVKAVAELRRAGLQVTLDHLGENVISPAQAAATADAYIELIEALATVGLADGAEMSVKLSAVGLSLQDIEGESGREVAARAALRIADVAYSAGARVTIDMEDHSTVDDTLAVVGELRATHPDVGCVLQAMLRRTGNDISELTGPGSRVRLVKGAYDEPESVAYQGPAEVDRAYVRGMKMLFEGKGYPMVGSHDPRMIAIAQSLAGRTGRAPGSFEFQLLYGIRTDEQRRLAAAGHTVRVYVPYGTDWYGYFTRRLAERPANLLFFLRALLSRG